jgi:AGZA family xanthine/uracil permease-like MFS transporter
VILILFLIDFYGSIAKLIGLAMNTNIVANGKLPQMREALLIDSLATTGGSVLGTSSLTVYVESGVGIGVGGRTGLTAVTCAILMLLCFAIAPFLQLVPVVATTGALLLVAVKLCPSRKELRSFGKIDIAALVLMQVVVVATFALDRAMLVGFVAYVCDAVWRRRSPDPYMLFSLFVLGIGVLVQLL